jgi:hypothetical protein
MKTQLFLSYLLVADTVTKSLLTKSQLTEVSRTESQKYRFDNFLLLVGIWSFKFQVWIQSFGNESLGLQSIGIQSPRHCQVTMFQWNSTL